MTDEEIIAYAATRPEIVWGWSEKLRGRKWRERVEQLAEELDVELCWNEPIRAGDLYIAARNTGPHLLECRALGMACVFPVGIGYAFDFPECVLVRERAAPRGS